MARPAVVMNLTKKAAERAANSAGARSAAIWKRRDRSPLHWARELDGIDLQLLRSVARAERAATGPAEQRRLDRLEVGQYVRSIPADPPGAGPSPVLKYALTQKGRDAVAANEPSRAEMIQRLEDACARTRANFQAAAKAFNECVAETPSGLPTSDGVFRIEQAGERCRSAMSQYARAIRQFNEFVRDGKPPSDFE